MVNLNKYNQEKFVNREQPLAIIHEKLQKLSASPAPKESELIHFWGMGGRGKSFLKRQIKTIYKDNNSGPSRSNYLIIDWDGHALLNKAYSMPEILIYFRNEFARYGFEMKRFTKFITYYRKCTSTSLPDIIDEHEESITKSIFKGIFSFISQSTGFGAAIDGIIDISQTSSRRKENKLLKQEYEDFSNLEAETMVTVLLEAFIKDINQEIKDRKIIFIIDTFEDIRSINLSFIFSRKTEFRHISGLFYALQSSLWIVFGRDKTKFNDNQVSYQLNNFDIEETLTYMRENLQNIPEDNINEVISYSRGWPLLLSELHYELSSTHGNITTEFFDELKSEQAAQQVIKNRYKKYFSKDFNDEQNINLLKILFAFRQWTIHKENMTDSDLYKFTQEYYENALQTINITSELQQLFKLSFINKLTEPKRSTTYEIDRSVYSALYDQTIDGEPVIPDTLKENVITFLLQKLSSKDEQVEGETANHNIRIDKNQAEVTQLIDLIFSYYDESTPNELFKHVMQILEDNHIDKSITAWIQVILLEKFSTDYLSTQPGQQLIKQVMTYFQSFEIVEYTDRFVNLLNDVNNSQSLNEKLGYYFYSIGRLAYAKLYLEKAIPSLDLFKNAMLYVTSADDNIYADPAFRRLSVTPDQLIMGLEIESETEFMNPSEENMYLYRKFLYHTRQLIRIQIELGDSTQLSHLIAAWDIAINYDQENEPVNVLHSLWLNIDVMMLQKAVWQPSVIEDFKKSFIPILNQNKFFAIEHPSFILSVFKFANLLFEYGYYQLQEILYEYVVDVIQLIMTEEVSEQYDLSAISEMLGSPSYNRYLLHRGMILSQLFDESDSERTKIREETYNYYETRVGEEWQLPLKLEELIETGKFDLKVMKFLNLKDDYLSLLNRIIDKLDDIDKNFYYLADFYYLKGIYKLEHGKLRESHLCFHRARHIIFNSLGKFIETSKTFIPYETHELFTQFRLLKNHSITMTKPEFTIFKERAEFNQKMIMNSYEDDLPDATTFYLMSVEIIEGLEAIIHKEKYQANMKEVNTLFMTMTNQQFNQAVQELGKCLFLDVTEKYNREYLFYKKKLTPVPLNNNVANVVQNATHDWENYKIPEENKNIYYQIASEDLLYFLNNDYDFNVFFNRYFMRLQDFFKLFHKQTNQRGTNFEQLTDIIIDIQFANNKHRNKILETLIDALKFN